MGVVVLDIIPQLLAVRHPGHVAPEAAGPLDHFNFFVEGNFWIGGVENFTEQLDGLAFKVCQGSVHVTIDNEFHLPLTGRPLKSA